MEALLGALSTGLEGSAVHATFRCRMLLERSLTAVDLGKARGTVIYVTLWLSISEDNLSGGGGREARTTYTICDSSSSSVAY